MTGHFLYPTTHAHLSCLRMLLPNSIFDWFFQKDRCQIRASTLPRAHLHEHARTSALAHLPEHTSASAFARAHDAHIRTNALGRAYFAQSSLTEHLHGALAQSNLFRSLAASNFKERFHKSPARANSNERACARKPARRKTHSPAVAHGSVMDCTDLRSAPSTTQNPNYLAIPARAPQWLSNGH